jgi:polyhydroxyalkanoate synthesis regulator phasin
MALEPEKLLFMGIGLLDYVRDKLEELQDELIRRGEERSEDFREFFGDLIQNIPSLKSNAGTTPKWDEPDEESDDVPGLLGDLDVKSTVNDLLDSAGLATGDDIRQLKDRIDRLARAVGNLETTKPAGA